MRYYYEVAMNVCIRPEKRSRFLGEVRRLTKRDDDWTRSNVSSLCVDSNNKLYYEELSEPPEQTDEFALWLRQFVCAGRIVYAAEDMQRWGYEFDGRGRAFELVFEERRGKELKR